MKTPFFTGVCTALVTPFTNGKINYPMLELLLARQMEAGIEAVVLSGTTGESATLTDEEKIELFRFAKAFAGNDLKVIAGTGSNSTAHAVSLSQGAEKAGADALLAVSPYYNKATPQGLHTHYLTLASAVSIPVILYNVPSRTGVDIPVPVYRSLSGIPNIIGVKEASTDVTKITKIRNACGPDFSVWSGNDDLTTPVISLGGRGVISVLSNILPAETQAMTEAALDGDFDTAADLQCKLQPLLELLFSEVNPIPVKAALSILGLDCGPCRLPLTPMSNDNYRRLENYLRP